MNKPFPQRKSTRLKEYDYSNSGYYFITICVRNMITSFGKIRNGKMILNKYGEIVKKRWNELSERYQYVDLDYYVVMPNHFHGIIIIDPVGTGRDLSLQPKIKSLSELMGVFKTTSSKQIHLAGLTLNFESKLVFGFCHWVLSF